MAKISEFDVLCILQELNPELTCGDAKIAIERLKNSGLVASLEDCQIKSIVPQKNGTWTDGFTNYDAYYCTCGTLVKPKYRYCHECGKKLNWDGIFGGCK